MKFIFSKFLLILCLISLSSNISFPLGTQNTGFQTTSSFQEIDVHSNCRQVKHSSSDSFFVPTKSAYEWLQFYTNTPSSVNIDNCYTYSWDTSSWGSCSQTCGGGTQSRSVTCLRSDGATVSDSFCSGSKPSSSKSCNTQSCSTSGPWTTGSWSGCSQTCGGGIQTRSVTCNYDSCTGSEPSSSKSCNTQSCSLASCEITSSDNCIGSFGNCPCYTSYFGTYEHGESPWPVYQSGAPGDYVDGYSGMADAVCDDGTFVISNPTCYRFGTFSEPTWNSGSHSNARVSSVREEEFCQSKGYDTYSTSNIFGNDPTNYDDKAGEDIFACWNQEGGCTNCKDETECNVITWIYCRDN